MQRHDVRHLPVLEAEALVGIVSERDLAMVAALRPDGWQELPVAEAMTPKPLTVRADKPVHEVAAIMAEHRYGAALVLDASEHLVGLFTTTDALRVLAGSYATQ